MTACDTRIGVIGLGQMGGALTRSMIAQQVCPADQIRAYDVDAQRLNAFCAAQHIGAASTLSELVAASNVLLVAVKPHVVRSVLTEIASVPLPSRPPLVISIAAGVSLSALESVLPEGVPVIRVMPNLPASIGYGASAYAMGVAATNEHAALVEEMLSAGGLVVRVEERLMNAVTALSGSGPAYVLLLVEALADAGVREGLPRQTALQLATHTVLGAAQLALSSDDHIALWKERVCTPAGTTIEALYELEAAGLHGLIMTAVHAARKRADAIERGE